MTTSDSFEHEIKAFFLREKIRFVDASSSYDRLDFTIQDKSGQPAFHLDAKEKRQRYAMANWPKFARESDLFILDDLTVRKCLAFAPRSGVLIRDNIRNAYIFFSVVDLALMPRKRVNRIIDNRKTEVKGKWLINLRNGRTFSSLDDSILHIRRFTRDLNGILFDTLECHGEYVEERVELGGATRKPSHWEEDIRSTR